MNNTTARLTIEQYFGENRRHFGATVDIHRNRWEFLESFQSLSMRDLDHHPFQKALNVNQDRLGRLGSHREGCAGFSSVCAFFLDVVDFLTLPAVFYLQQSNIYSHLSYEHVLWHWKSSNVSHENESGFIEVNIDWESHREIFELFNLWRSHLWRYSSILIFFIHTHY